MRDGDPETHTKPVVRQILDAGVMAVIRTPDAASAVRAALAVVAGGVRVAEVTFTVPEAARAIAALRRHVDAGDAGPGVVLGAGTVVTADDAAAAADAGAEFLVSPHLSPAMMDCCCARGLGAFPGAMTPGEVYAAWSAGADVVKVFPAARFGPAYFRDLLGPYPRVRLMPTGGVDASNLAAWRSAGAVAVGVGGDLVDQKAVATGDWEELTRRARMLTAAWRDSTRHNPS